MATLTIKVGDLGMVGKGDRTPVFQGRGLRDLTDLTTSGTAAYAQENSADFVSHKNETARIKCSGGSVRIVVSESTAATSSTGFSMDDGDEIDFILGAGDKISAIDE